MKLYFFFSSYCQNDRELRREIFSIHKMYIIPYVIKNISVIKITLSSRSSDSSLISQNNSSRKMLLDSKTNLKIKNSKEQSRERKIGASYEAHLRRSWDRQ